MYQNGSKGNFVSKNSRSLPNASCMRGTGNYFHMHQLISPPQHGSRWIIHIIILVAEETVTERLRDLSKATQQGKDLNPDTVFPQAPVCSFSDNPKDSGNYVLWSTKHTDSIEILIKTIKASPGKFLSLKRATNLSLCFWVKLQSTLWVNTEKILIVQAASF